ncbi:hypothetical protein [Tardiphaga sp. OK245]|uniref:hypothetical protein n=1 Tax=Tardiphaga sp. OK245 TaxID=1855306 RepID=UPI0008A7A3BF|nr:hypothetical protein [Tardiphaga sp. OK245]SEI19707.1 hypothetical protein SAMN05216367_4939 [Tardiphaga sp. OK245]
MESLKQFEWFKDPNGYRVAFVSPSSRRVSFIKPNRNWGDEKFEKAPDKVSQLSIRTTEYRGEKRPPKSGLYIVGHQAYLNARNSEPSHVAVRPFQSDDLISLNLLKNATSPNSWIDFSNKFGLLGTAKERWFLTGRDPKVFMCTVEAEGEFHHLLNVLRRIYGYFPAIKAANTDYLSRFIEWESDDVVRETWGPRLGNVQTKPAIAIRGFSSEDDDALRAMKSPDLIAPAAISIRDHVNRYLKDSLSLEIDFDQKQQKFTSSLRYGSLGAALVAEAVEFMAGRFEAQQCKVCSSWFRIGHEQKRRDRIFCSSACKMRDYRSRKSIPA